MTLFEFSSLFADAYEIMQNVSEGSSETGTLLSRTKLTRICICRTLEACSYLYHCIFLLHTLGHASYESELVIPLIILIYFTH